MVRERSSRPEKISRFARHRAGWAGKKKTGDPIAPAINQEENKDEYVIYVAVPGMQRKDFTVTIFNKSLRITAIKQEALHCFPGDDEQEFIQWSETFTLPGDADTLMTAAVYRNGELAVHIPKGKSGLRISPVKVFVY